MKTPKLEVLNYPLTPIPLRPCSIPKKGERSEGRDGKRGGIRRDVYRYHERDVIHDTMTRDVRVRSVTEVSGPLRNRSRPSPSLVVSSSLSVRSSTYHHVPPPTSHPVTKPTGLLSRGPNIRLEHSLAELEVEYPLPYVLNPPRPSCITTLR